MWGPVTEKLEILLRTFQKKGDRDGVSSGTLFHPSGTRRPVFRLLTFTVYLFTVCPDLLVYPLPPWVVNCKSPLPPCVVNWKVLRGGGVFIRFYPLIIVSLKLFIEWGKVISFFREGLEGGRVSRKFSRLCNRNWNFHHTPVSTTLSLVGTGDL